MVHVKPKRPLVPVPFLQSTIDEIVSAHTEKALTHVLDKFDSPHHFERPEERNLLNWFKVLNRFDELLERYVASRNVFSDAPSSDRTPAHQSAAAGPSPSSAPNARKPASALADASPSPPAPSPAFPLAAPLPERSGTSAVDVSSAKHDPAPDKHPRAFVPSPALVRLILRLTQRLIRNASHDTRTVYNSVEHIGALLADDNSAIVLLALEILNMLMQRSHKLRSHRTHITFELSERLLDMAVGWGGRENRLGLLECCSSKNVDSLPADGSRLYFEYTKSSSSSSPTGQSSEAPSIRVERQPENPAKKPQMNLHSRFVVGPIPLPISPSRNIVSPTREPTVTTSGATSAIVVDDVRAFEGQERWLLNFASRHNVPKAKWFSLLCAFRRAKRFSEGRDARIELTVVRLYAITTLYQMQPLPPSLHDLLAKEPELLQDIVALASANSSDGIDDIPRCLRIIAIRCMTAMSTDRHRVASIMLATGVSAHHGALPTLLRTEISSLLSSSTDGSNIAGERNRSEAMTTERGPECQSGSATGERNSRGIGPLTLFAECNRIPLIVQRIHTTEYLLALVHSLAVAAGTSGATPLANSGVLGILIPLLTDGDIRHSRVVAQAIRAMQAVVEGSPQTLGCQMFRDHDGLALVAKRIAAEVGVDDSELSAEEQSSIDEAAEEDALKKRGESRALYERLGRRQMTPSEALEHPPPSSGTTSRGLLPHSKWALLRALHQLLLRALGNGGSEVRELVVGSSLPKALRKIMAQPFLHGGSLFQSAATVTTEIAHAEPTATAELVKAGLATTVLKTINLGLPPCGEGIKCIPNLLAALCLAPTARELIVSSKPLRLYLLRLATPFYTRALHGESPVIIGSALDELMRHVEALRMDGNQAMIEYLRLSAKFVETDTKGFRRSSRVGAGSSTSKTESQSQVDGLCPVEKAAPSTTSSGALKGDQEKSSPDAVLLDKMKLAVANNSCRLVGFPQGSSEHQEGIVQNGGLDHMIHLRFGPALASAEASVREGYSFSRHYPTPAMTVVSLVTSLRNFSSRHAASVLKSLFTVILKDAATVLKISKDLDDAWLPQEDSSIQKRERSSATDVGIESKTSLPDIPDKAAVDQALKTESAICTSADVSKPAALGIGDVGEGDGRRSILRRKLSDALKKLRVGVVLLGGLSLRGSGTSAGVWETARGSQVAAIVSTVERAARYHLAIVYTGLTLSASSDGDLSTARVTAAADPEMKGVRAELANQYLGDLDKAVGLPVTTNSLFMEACKSYKVPPEGHEPVRQEVKGLAWCLVTFAVAAQRLYSTLSKGLTFSSRRLSRDPARYAASARSLAATIGRVFALHLMAAESLWDTKVLTMGDGQVVAAWDYVRGILIEIKGTLFDESRRVTQSLILRSFLDAGGAEALIKACRPFLVVQATSSKLLRGTDGIGLGGMDTKSEQELDRLLQNNSLSVSSYVLALSDIFNELRGEKSGITRQAAGSENTPVEQKEDTVMSSDSISNQARAISRIVVSESAPGHETLSAASTEDLRANEDLLAILSSQAKVKALKERTGRARDAAFKHCKTVAIRRVASDVWNTLCGFLHLLGSCPGLLNSTSSPMPESGASATEWEPRDIQRSALTVTLQLLTTVTEHPEDLLSSFRPEGSAMSDLLVIVHTTSQVADDLSQKSNENDAAASVPEEAEAFIERQEEAAAVRVFSPDPEMLQSLVEMGFSERRAASALRRTAPGGVQYAAEWLLTHREEDDDSADSDEEGEPREWDEGGERDGDAEADAEVDNDAEESNEIDDVGDGEPTPDSNEAAAGSSPSHRPPTGASREDAMVDTESPDASEVLNTSIGAPTQRNVPGQSSGDQPLPERASGSAKHKREHSKSTSAKGKENVVNVVVDQDGPRLLKSSMDTELALLTAALEKSKIVPQSDVAPLVSMASTHIGPSLGPGFSGVSEKGGVKGTLSISPISVDSFTEAKKRLFETLLDVTRVVIRESESHIHGRHLPYLAVELLSVMQKDGTLREDGALEFARLLENGLQLALAEEQGFEEGMAAGLQGQTAAIWSHYGGSHARRALQSRGTFKLAFDCLEQTLAEWARAVKSPRVDIEATQPIRKLSIREDKTSRKDATALENVAVSTMTTLVPVAKHEARMLKRITTSILLLDALVRNEAKDRIIQRSKETGKPTEDDSGARDKNGAEGKQAEKMDIGENSDEDEVEGDAGRANSKDSLGRSKKPLTRVLRDIFGSASSAMEIDAKPSEENAVDLDAVRKAAEAGKAKMIDSAKTSIGKWMAMDVEGAISYFRKEMLLGHCFLLLNLWKGIEVGDALLAVLQLLGSLTAQWPLAEAAMKDGVIPLLLSLPQLEAGQARSTDYKVVRLLIKTILRHLIEDPETLQEAMVSELRSLFSSGQSRTRPSISVRSLIMSTSPMVARDMQSFISALTSTVGGSDADRRELQLIDYKVLTSAEVEPLLERRSNVKDVISALSSLVSEKLDEESSRKQISNSHLSTLEPKKGEVFGLSRYALELISEFVEFSQIAAVAYIKTASPSMDVPGSALDFVIQKILALPGLEAEESGGLPTPRVTREREELSNAARTLFLALCSKTANTHEEAVASLAKAVRLEAEKQEVRPAFIAGLAQCIAPGTRLRVLRVVLESGMANDLARSVRTLDLSVEENFDVAMFVLRALSLIGQAATHLARHGDGTADDVSFGSSSRDPWSSLRDREDALGHSSSYMVL